jgi:hypothetical protein
MAKKDQKKAVGLRAIKESIDRGEAALKSRRVTIPANKRYIYFPADAVAFIVEPGKAFPDELTKFIDMEAETKAKKLLEDMIAQRNSCCRQVSPEEVLQTCLDQIHSQGDNAQNEIVAKIIGHIKAKRQQFIANVEKQLNTAKQQLESATQALEGLELVQAGGFDRLNFRQS